jgi:predicted ATPase
MLLGWVRGQSGLLTHAAQEIQAGLHAYQETGARMMLPYFLVLLAETEMQRREPESALAHLEAAKEMIDITGTRFYEAELYRIMGCLLAGYLQKRSEAHHAFLQAIHIAANQGNVLLQHYARQSLNEFLSSKHRSRRRPKHTP